ncbi:MAG: aromatic-ring-hydroxylating dioxygenase subunit beta [Actinobacteria bacterium]|nr:aromatic-ring-hydroxylating dioxygenase subunit beta [Actinomycetota bacterium]
MAATSADVDPDTRAAITDFLFQEAYLIDERRFGEWLDMFDEEARYVVPVRVTREAGADWQLSPDSTIFDDTKQTLGIRIARLRTDFAWAEQPPSRTRHYVSNVLVDAGEASGEYTVRSNCLVYRSRGNLPRPDLFSCARRHELRLDPAGLKIKNRWTVLDESMVSAHNLSIFL